MGDPKRRIEKLEQVIDSGEPVRVVVNWDENPEPPGPGVKVITWDDDKEIDDDDRAAAE